KSPRKRHQLVFDVAARQDGEAKVVFRLIHLVPALACSSAWRARAFFSRMLSASAGHLKGFGCALRSVIQASIAAISSFTLLNTPRRMRCRVISANRRSTRLIQDDEVGVKCILKRLFRFNHALTCFVLWVR